MSTDESSSAECLVAVYGTLRRGHANSHMLAQASFIGTDTLNAIVLYDLGEYPGAKLARSDGIEVEVYRIDRQTLAALDQLEEFDPANPASSLYVRSELQTVFGKAWVYLYQGAVVGRRPLRAGRWVPRTVDHATAAPR